jgi:hypothetical protein
LHPVALPCIAAVKSRVEQSDLIGMARGRLRFFL